MAIDSIADAWRFDARALCTLAFGLTTLLAGCAGGESTDAVSPPASGPQIDFSANPTTVNAGGVATLSWSATNATACNASGGWSGSRAPSGSESTGALSATRTYTLTCTGGGGNTSRSATVTVNGGGGAPTLSFNANPTTVAAGASATLTWSATNATGCTAGDAWSGPKPTSGSEPVGPINATSTYTLTCSGSGGSVDAQVTVSVFTQGAARLSGAVDSSLVRWSPTNSVYVFAGSDNTSGTPVEIVPVSQDDGTCTFRYAVATLPDGSYTVALSSDGGVSFKRSANVTLSGAAAVQSLTAARVVQVGPTRQYRTVSAAAGAVQDGDVVEIDAGVYSADVASWYRNNLTLRGVGGRAHLQADGADAQGKGTWVIAGRNALVENIEFSGAAVADLNGAGIRAEGQNLTICNSYFHNNENGILGGGGELLIEYSEFARNGQCPQGSGCAHNMYISGATRFTLRHSYSHHANEGHNVKSRARENFILYNRIMDEVDGNSSYAVDIPDGGVTYLIGNLIQQGPNTENSSMVAYAAESASNPLQQLYVVNNTLVNDRGSGTFLSIRSGTTARITNNLFVGNGTTIGGPGGNVTNLQTNSPALLSQGGYDYRLTATSPARDVGSDPGSVNGVALTPLYQYRHNAAREPRPGQGTIDIGAYEYAP